MTSTHGRAQDFRPISSIAIKIAHPRKPVTVSTSMLCDIKQMLREFSSILLYRRADIADEEKKVHQLLHPIILPFIAQANSKYIEVLYIYNSKFLVGQKMME